MIVLTLTEDQALDLRNLLDYAKTSALYDADLGTDGIKEIRQSANSFLSLLPAVHPSHSSPMSYSQKARAA